MGFKDAFRRAGRHVREASAQLTNRLREERRPGRVNPADYVGDEQIESSFRRARETLAPDAEQLPVDFQLRQSGLIRRAYERILPVSHSQTLSLRYGREFLDDFMPLSKDAYIGRGSYKFVYRLPWRMVLKVSKEILPSDPLLGSLYREVDAEPERFLTAEEIELRDFLSRKKSSRRKDRLRFQFNRLGLERYHYWKVREVLPDLTLPTKFFMGVRYRKRMFLPGHSEKVTPMDSQIMLVGKHLKEFARAVKPASKASLFSRFSPRFDFDFETSQFQGIKKKALLKIAEDFRRLIRLTEDLAVKENLILDIHSENIIITLPEFELRIFDFHLFDEHLYDPSRLADRPEQDHIDVLEKFLDSLNSDDF